MKKYLIVVSSFLLFGGIAFAQGVPPSNPCAPLPLSAGQCEICSNSLLEARQDCTATGNVDSCLLCGLGLSLLCGQMNCGEVVNYADCHFDPEEGSPYCYNYGEARSSK